MIDLIVILVGVIIGLVVVLTDKPDKNVDGGGEYFSSHW